MTSRITLNRSAIFVGLLLSTSAFAQPAPGTPPPPPPAGAMTPPPPDQAPPPPAASVSRSGVVAQYLLAPRGEVEGLLLQDGTQVVVPPHLRATLTSSVRSGDSIKIDGNQENPTRIAAQSIANSSSGQTVVDQGPPSNPPVPDEGTHSEIYVGERVIKAMLTGPRGETNGVILQDGSIVRFAPQLALVQANRLSLGQSIAVSGMGVQNQYGRVLEVQSLAAN